MTKVTVNIDDLTLGGRKVKEFNPGVVEAQYIWALHKKLRIAIVVRGFTIVDGYRRVQCAKLLGINQIEVWRFE